MSREPKTILIRRGIPNKCKYCACDSKGSPIRGFDRLGDIRKHWQKEIKWGYVMLVRELDKQPDFTALNETKAMLEKILKSYGRKKK